MFGIMKVSNERGGVSLYNGVPFWSGVVSSGLAQVDDTIALSRGQLDTKNYAIHTTSNVTCGIGIMAGLEYGAIIRISHFTRDRNDCWFHPFRNSGESYRLFSGL